MFARNAPGPAHSACVGPYFGEWEFRRSRLIHVIGYAHTELDLIFCL